MMSCSKSIRRVKWCNHQSLQLIRWNVNYIPMKTSYRDISRNRIWICYCASAREISEAMEVNTTFSETRNLRKKPFWVWMCRRNGYQRLEQHFGVSLSFRHTRPKAPHRSAVKRCVYIYEKMGDVERNELLMGAFAFIRGESQLTTARDSLQYVGPTFMCMNFMTFTENCLLHWAFFWPLQ